MGPGEALVIRGMHQASVARKNVRKQEDSLEGLHIVNSALQRLSSLLKGGSDARRAYKRDVAASLIIGRELDLGQV